MRSKHHETVPLVLSEEVSDTLSTSGPVVALKSNVITHGLVHPENAATARKVTEAVRTGGAIPATIGIDGSRIIIGMTDADIEGYSRGS